MSDIKIVEEILENYRNSINNLKTFKELTKLERDEVIEGLSLKASTISDVAPSTTNKISSKTENSALNIDRHMSYTEEEKAELDNMQKKVDTYKPQVFKMLKDLSPINRTLIISIYIDKKSYNQVICELVKKYPEAWNLTSRQGIQKRKIIVLKQMHKSYMQ